MVAMPRFTATVRGHWDSLRIKAKAKVMTTEAEDAVLDVELYARVKDAEPDVEHHGAVGEMNLPRFVSSVSCNV